MTASVQRNRSAAGPPAATPAVSRADWPAGPAARRGDWPGGPGGGTPYADSLPLYLNPSCDPFMDFSKYFLHLFPLQPIK
ncbi:hypothetical protein AAFF_G00294930 [Aldrovandia affinis]|uniref:Uncharacterized protein n=1 Tax=Aldrovandia affinis TaxID=143900 RepID=A0AAD7W1S9_9TELE|nr:hypothetical protein AAFF_G00294930 [Aldrovandia affinis]